MTSLPTTPLLAVATARRKRDGRRVIVLRWGDQARELSVEEARRLRDGLISAISEVAE